MRIKVHKPISERSIAMIAATVTLVVALALSHIAQAAGEVFSSPSNKTIYEGQNITITDLQVNGTGNDELDMNLYASNGSLQFNNSDGLTFNGPSYGSSLQFSGTRSAINTALSTLMYFADEPGTHTVEATLGGGDGDVYNPTNGHIYQVVEVGGEGIDWNDAKTAAEAMTYNGIPGYLATITSAGEQAFILDRISEDGWVGANDVAAEGQWRWVTGPETGTLFWSGNGESGNVVGDEYENWNQSGQSVEPNNAGEGEDCAEVRFTGGASGEWNDRDCGATNMSYVVEFGAGNDVPIVASTDFSVTVAEAPEIAFTNLSPADNSTVVPIDRVSITYNQPMQVSELTVYVRNAADDSVVAEIWTGETDDNLTFTHVLPEMLAPGNYYVTVSTWGMEGLVEYYDGFEDENTWNFTVAENGGIATEVEEAAPNEGDGNNDGTQDSLQPNVASFVDPVTGEYAVLEVDEECSITNVSVVASSANDPSGYIYPAGLMDFALDCGTPGFTATITQYYYGVNEGNFIVRKFNPNTGLYSTIDTAIISKQTIDGSAVTVATYQVTDGGLLDLDGEVNGEIVDPAGLALAVVGTPNTGGKPADFLSAVVIASAGLSFIGAAGFYAYRQLRGRA